MILDEYHCFLKKTLAIVGQDIGTHISILKT